MVHNNKKRSTAMKCNMGTTDRILRTIVGLAIAGVGIYLGSWWGLAAIVPLWTAVTGHCPAYLPFGWSTAGTKNVIRAHKGAR
jgi:hypothetical protein